ncbi:MAG TPA: 30S ribosomal protein S8 [Candidatus Nanoarchaeia archaeon]|nr:30S ribosomal protein S8 [Candidatus Nanoarchaeia archaeon]
MTMMNDPLASVLSNMLNQERLGRRECLVHPASKLITSVLTILNESGYTGKAEKVADARGGVLKLNLLGAINKCGAIKPRFAVTLPEFEKFERRFLPAKDMGILVVSTPYGLMTHIQAKQKNTGGRLIAYCY